MLRKEMPILLVLVAILITACGPISPTPEVMMDETSDAMMEATPTTVEDKSSELMVDQTPEVMQEMDVESMMEETPEAMAEEQMQEVMTPEWFNIALTDVNTGETFKIADYQGQVVLVETMAMWCSVCLKQQINVRALHELSIGEYVSVALDIDPNENAGALRTYTGNNGFDWVYAISPGQLSRELAESYGNLFLNPPSAPMLIIDRDGKVYPLPFGLKSTEQLKQALEPFLDGEM